MNAPPLDRNTVAGLAIVIGPAAALLGFMLLLRAPPSSRLRRAALLAVRVFWVALGIGMLVAFAMQFAEAPSWRWPDPMILLMMLVWPVLLGVISLRRHRTGAADPETPQ